MQAPWLEVRKVRARSTDAQRATATHTGSGGAQPAPQQCRIRKPRLAVLAVGWLVTEYSSISSIWKVNFEIIQTFKADVKGYYHH